MSDPSFLEKTEEEIRQEVFAIATQETGISNFKSTGVLRGFLETIVASIKQLYESDINPIYLNATLDDASGDFLAMWGVLLGVTRKQAERTTGSFIGQAYAAGAISAGSWVAVTGTDLRFRVSQDITFQAGEFSLPVTAAIPGSEYNVSPGTSIYLTKVVNGVELLTVPTDWIEALGTDAEEDAPYRSRIKDRWQSQSLGDTRAAYKFYATSVDGVLEAKIIRTPRGPGSTDVIIAAVNGVPGSELLSAVDAALHDHELMGFDVQVKPPDTTTISVQIEFTGAATDADVRLIAENYVYGLGIGSRFAIRDLYALYDDVDVDTVEILSPDRDVEPDESGIITASVTATKVAT
ncbi:baseplate J/gp47 family protein [Sediminispirochaeta bajacaliforniensis]|uniref:baseplate J/gp47 family protein n=1 Tax=Sediminispirochaeta bajacaliforniensis TaxID=148 RepID=UPI00036E711D|nr:baseplate J/gp47 family protein [Sediminispirochaeta bajacaliforniensis]